MYTIEERTQIFTTYWNANIRYSKIPQHTYSVKDMFGFPFNIQECKLILTPLDKITEEHAIEVARIYFRDTNATVAEGMHIVHKIRTEFNLSVYAFDTVQRILDFLRKERYDVGYGSIH